MSPPQPSDGRPRMAPGRGLYTGLVYGGAYLTSEILSTAALFEWMGASARVLAVIRGDLLALLGGYLALGAVCGVLLSPLVWAAERALPPRWRGPGINLMLLAWTFTAVALFWNVESILPRRAYAFGAFGALGLILLVMLAGRLGARALRALPERARVPALGAAVAVAVVVVGAAALRQGPPDGAGSVTAGAGPSDRPNVVLIVVDTLRRDHVSAYGYARRTTPHIDRIAAEGTLYEHAYSTASWTLPAHATLFTGLYSSTHQTDLGSIYLGQDKRTLAEVLRGHGYRTAGFSANPWLNPRSGLEQGFERLDYVAEQVVTGSLFLSLAVERWRGLRHEPPPDLGGAAVTDAVVAWIEEAAPGPFLAFANYMEVHEPYGSVPEPYFSSFIDRPLPTDAGRAWIRDTPLFFCRDCSAGGTTDGGARCEDGRWRVQPERLREAEALYDAGLLYVDAQIARIYDTLARRGLLDRTLVIVTSDHGETLGERGQMGHGWLYNSVLEIPLIVRYPSLFPPGRREPGTASLVDVLATVEDAAGLPPSPTDGVSLVPRQALPARPVLAESAAFPEKAWRALGLRLRCDYSSKSRDTASLQSGTHKLIWSSAGDHELYDLGQDPREEHDLHASRGPEAGKLAEALNGWRSALRKRRSGARGYEVDPATRKALESLGYVH